MGRHEDIQMQLRSWDEAKKGVQRTAVETLAGEKRVAVLDSGEVALIGLCEPHLDCQAAHDPFWIDTIDGYDQGETLPFSEIYQRVQRLNDAVRRAQLPRSGGTALALAILALDMVGMPDYVDFNAHESQSRLGVGAIRHVDKGARHS
jgi:hypothetical protein